MKSWIDNPIYNFIAATVIVGFGGHEGFGHGVGQCGGTVTVEVVGQLESDCQQVLEMIVERIHTQGRLLGG